MEVEDRADTWSCSHNGEVAAAYVVAGCKSFADFGRRFQRGQHLMPLNSCEQETKVIVTLFEGVEGRSSIRLHTA